MPPKGAAGAACLRLRGMRDCCAQSTRPSPVEEGEVLVHSSAGNGLMFCSVVH